MIDQMALRYHPIRMRWLYEQSVYGDHVLYATDQANAIEGGYLLGSAAFLDDIDNMVIDRLEGLEDHYHKWMRSSHAIIDLTNQMDYIQPLAEDDQRFAVEALVCEEETYFHFGQEVHGYEGFYAKYEPHKWGLSFALVSGGDCSDADLPEEELALSFSDVYYGFLGHGEDPIGQDIDSSTNEDENLSEEDEVRYVGAMRHMLAVLRHVHIMSGNMQKCWPGDAPENLARRAEIIQAAKAGKREISSENSAIDILWARGWTEVQLMPVPGVCDVMPHPDVEKIEDEAERIREFQRFARHAVQLERRRGSEGGWEITSEVLSIALEQAFQLGARAGANQSPYLDLMTSQYASEAAWMLGIAAFGKTPGVPIQNARYVQRNDDRWQLWLDDDEMMIPSFSDEAIQEMHKIGLVRIAHCEAKPTARILRFHHFFHPVTRGDDYGQLPW